MRTSTGGWLASQNVNLHPPHGLACRDSGVSARMRRRLAHPRCAPEWRAQRRSSLGSKPGLRAARCSPAPPCGGGGGDALRAPPALSQNARSNSQQKKSSDGRGWNYVVEVKKNIERERTRLHPRVPAAAPRPPPSAAGRRARRSPRGLLLRRRLPARSVLQLRLRLRRDPLVEAPRRPRAAGRAAAGGDVPAAAVGAARRGGLPPAVGWTLRYKRSRHRDTVVSGRSRPRWLPQRGEKGARWEWRPSVSRACAPPPARRDPAASALPSANDAKGSFPSLRRYSRDGGGRGGGPAAAAPRRPCAPALCLSRAASSSYAYGSSSANCPPACRPRRRRACCCCCCWSKSSLPRR